MSEFNIPSPTPLDYATMTIDDIIEWCQENNQVAWLQRTAAKKTKVEVYPRVRGEDGKCLRTPDGKYIFDHEATPRIEERPISFVKIKALFVDKFMPEIKPNKGKKKKSMHERIAGLS